MKNIINNVIASKPMALKQLFFKYKIKKTPSYDNIMHLYNIAGEPFLFELFNIISKEKNNQEGQNDQSTNQQNLIEAQEKNNNWQNFKSWFNTALINFNTTATNVNQLIENVKGDKNQNDFKEIPLTETKKDNTFKYVIICGVIIIFAFIIFKKK